MKMPTASKVNIDAIGNREHASIGMLAFIVKRSHSCKFRY